MAAFRIPGCLLVILLNDSSVYQLLARVVNQFPIAVDNIHVTGFSQVHVLADLLNPGKIHVNQHHAVHDLSIFGHLYRTA